MKARKEDLISEEEEKQAQSNLSLFKHLPGHLLFNRVVQKKQESSGSLNCALLMKDWLLVNKLLRLGVRPDSDTINCALLSGREEIVSYLLETNPSLSFDQNSKLCAAMGKLLKKFFKKIKKIKQEKKSISQITKGLKSSYYYYPLCTDPQILPNLRRNEGFEMGFDKGSQWQRNRDESIIDKNKTFISSILDLILLDQASSNTDKFRSMLSFFLNDVRAVGLDPESSTRVGKIGA